MDSSYLIGKQQDHLFGLAAFTPPDPGYIALYSDRITTELSGNNYARKSVAMDNTIWGRSGGEVKNSVSATPIAFAAASGAWSEALAWSIMDAASSGNMLFWSWLHDSRKVGIADAGTDVITSPAHGFSDTDRVAAEAVFGQTFPTGISEGAVLYVRDSTTDTYKVAATSGGAAINITGDGILLAYHLTPKTAGSGDVVQFNQNELIHHRY